MSETLEIGFSDLHYEAQKQVLDFYGIDDPEEINLGIVPLAILEKGESDDKG